MKKPLKCFLMLAMTASLLFSMTSAAIAESEDKRIYLTPEEQAFIDENPVVRAGTIGGIAPIASFSNGRMTGISGGILDMITEMTGLEFKSREYSNMDELTKAVLDGKLDLLVAVSSQYISDELRWYPQSPPYLSSETVLFIRGGVDASDLSNAVYAGVKEGPLPEGVNESLAKFYDNKVLTLNAVAYGRADYTYGNDYSIAYYTLQNDYTGVMTVPQGKETCEYRLLYLNNSHAFVSLMNKAINAIYAKDLQHIILQATSNVDRKMSLANVVADYSTELGTLITLVILVLAASTIIAIRSGEQSRKQIRRMMLLSEASDEFIFDYDIHKDELSLTSKCRELLEAPPEIKHYRFSLHKIPTLPSGFDLTQNDGAELSLGDRGQYRVVSFSVSDKRNRSEYIIGKLIDISEEKKTIQELTAKAETDALTGLLNPVAVKRLMEQEYSTAQYGGAIIVCDIDKFKDVNDRYGHAAGDGVLMDFADKLKDTFRGGDIIGRMGGDEFCVYMSGAVNKKIVSSRLKALQNRIKAHDPEIAPYTLSIGAVLCSGSASFEETMECADKAMYAAKNGGRDRFEIVSMENE